MRVEDIQKYDIVRVAVVRKDYLQYGMTMDCQVYYRNRTSKGWYCKAYILDSDEDGRGLRTTTIREREGFEISLVRSIRSELEKMRSI